jgi:phage baseplate assembly protein W
MTDVPHFSFPFRFAAPNVAVSEQDSIDEIADCCLAILLCPLGYRVELPEFGLQDPTFSSPAPDIDLIRQAVELWEPRAQLLLDENPDLWDELVTHVETYVRVRTES